MKRINVYLTEQQIERLKRLADTTDVTVSRHIRKAIEEYLSLRLLPTEPFVPLSDVAIGPMQVFSKNVSIPLDNSMPRVKTNNIGFGNESGEEWHL